MPVKPPRRYPVITYLNVENSYIGDIDGILRRAASDLDKRIKGVGGLGSSDQLTRLQLKAQKAAIEAHLEQDWKDIGKAIDAGQKAAVKAASEVVSRYEGLLTSKIADPATLKLIATSEANRAAAGTRTLLDRLSGGYTPLAKNVYRTQQLTSGLVDNAINQALAQGMSANQFAKSVRDLISPTVPGGVSYAAKRLARTEINNAFHVGSIRRYKESGIVDLVNWELSSSHPEGDICDDMVTNGPYEIDDVPKKPHPQCLCFLSPELPTPEEFIKKLLNGDYDDSMGQLEEPIKMTKKAIDAALKGTLNPADLKTYKAAIQKQHVDTLALAKAKKNVEALGLGDDDAVDALIAANNKLKASKASTEAIREQFMKKYSIGVKQAGEVESPTSLWLGKPAPKKPVAPAAPKMYGPKAYDEFIAAAEQRFKDFAAKTGNLKNDLKKSNNWSYFQKVVNDNDINALDYLRSQKYIDEALHAKGVAAMKQATTISAKDAAAFKKASAAFADDTLKYTVDYNQWREVNGITSAAKGMEGALRHTTANQGISWANGNMTAPSGVGKTAATKYTGSAYGPWNADLRAAKGAAPKGSYAKSTKDLDAAMQAVPEDVIVHRGVGWSEFEINGSRPQYIPPPPPTSLIGTVQTNYGYMSTSVGSNAAFQKSVQMRIRIPEGHEAAWVRPISRYEHENELLLSRNTSIYVHDIYEENGRWVMDAEVVPRDADPSGWLPIPSARR